MSVAPELASSDRAQLIEKLQTLTKIETVDSVTWGSLWLADEGRLRGFIKELESPGRHYPFFMFSNPARTKSLKAWAAGACRNTGARRNTEESSPTDDEEETPVVPRKRKAEEMSETPTLGPSTPQSERSQISKNLCLQRDKGSCLLTKAGEPVEACPIYPFPLRNSRQDSTIFWYLLCYFLEDKKAESWEKAALGEEDGTEHCGNLLSLCPNAHGLWGKARFALQPIGKPHETTLIVRFFWLPVGKYSQAVRLTKVPALPSDLTSGPKNSKLWNCVTDTKIVSGDFIEITTQDPVTHPLPSMELLDMQWTLHRVAAISGVADASDEDIDGYDDDDQSDY